MGRAGIFFPLSGFLRDTHLQIYFPRVHGRDILESPGQDDPSVFLIGSALPAFGSAILHQLYSCVQLILDGQGADTVFIVPSLDMVSDLIPYVHQYSVPGIRLRLFHYVLFKGVGKGKGQAGLKHSGLLFL